MKYKKNLEELMDKLSYKEEDDSFKYNTGNYCSILPYVTNGRISYKERYKGITGAFARLISYNDVNYELNMDLLISNIIDDIQVISEDKIYLKNIIKAFIVSENGNINIFCSEMMKYIPLTDKKEGKGEKNIAKFIKDVLFEKQEIKIFSNSESINILEELILKNLNKISCEEKKKKEHEEKQYITKIQHIKNIFNKDLKYLSTKPELLIKYMPEFLAYYFTFYCIQLCFVIIKQWDGNLDTIEPFYFLLEWENSSNTREAYKRGFREIRQMSQQLLVNINLLEHLNAIHGTKNKLLYELENEYKELSFEEKKEIRIELNRWINIIRKRYNVEEINLMEYEYRDLVRELYESLHSYGAFDKGTASRYAKNHTEAISVYFTKINGRNGELLSINQEILIFFIELCLNGGKLKRNDLFLELEKRGLFFDRASKDIIIKKLDQLNMLEKKSDSGDAQYVKSIL